MCRQLCLLSCSTGVPSVAISLEIILWQTGDFKANKINLRAECYFFTKTIHLSLELQNSSRYIMTDADLFIFYSLGKDNCGSPLHAASLWAATEQGGILLTPTPGIFPSTQNF